MFHCFPILLRCLGWSKEIINFSKINFIPNMKQKFSLKLRNLGLKKIKKQRGHDRPPGVWKVEVDQVRTLRRWWWQQAALLDS